MRTGALPSFAAAAGSNQPLQLLLTTVLPLRSGLPVVAAAAVNSKNKKAKFSQKHPSKQQLKQQALKQMQHQQQQAQARKPPQQQQQQPKPAQGQQQQAQPRHQQSGQQQQQQSKQQQQQAKSKPQQPAQAKQQSAQQQGKQQQSGQSKHQHQQAHSKQRPPPQQQRQQKTEQKQGSHKTAAGKQQQQQQQAVKPALASRQDLPASSTHKPLRQELPLIRPAQPASAASAAAAAATAIRAAQQLLPPAAGDAQGPSQGAPAAGGGAATSSSSSSRSQQSPGKFDKVAGVSYSLAQAHAIGYKAAGVVLYDCAGPDMQPRLLLVREKNGVWNLPAGKIDRGEEGKHNPAATAARELEEESHSLIPAADTLPVLQASCPVFYCHASKMAIYLMRLTGGQQLPQLLEQRLAAGMQHPKAEGVDRLGWFTANQISRGVMVSGKKGLKADSSSSTLGTASASAAAAAAAGEGEEAAVAAAVLNTADVEQQLGSLQLQDGSPAAAIAQQQQQQQEELDGPLGVRVPLFRNIKKIRALLEVLGKGQAPEFGLQVVQQQQQQQSEQQQKATDTPLLAPSFQQLELPVKWAAYVNGAGSSTTGSSSGSRGGQEFLSADGSASHSTGAVGQQRSPAAAAGAGHGGSRSAGQQPWAIAVWSGQHDWPQQQQSERW